MEPAKEYSFIFALQARNLPCSITCNTGKEFANNFAILVRSLPNHTISAILVRSLPTIVLDMYMYMYQGRDTHSHSIEKLGMDLGTRLLDLYSDFKPKSLST